MSDHRISRGSLNATSLPASECGATLCGPPAGRMTSRSGPEAALANLSPMQAQERGLLTSGTCGLTGSGSSKSSALQSLLASKLQAKTAKYGSILYRLTWKPKITPSGRRICVQRASAPRTADTGIILSPWPTPLAADSRGRAGAAAHKVSELPNAVCLMLTDKLERKCSDGTELIGSEARMGSGGLLRAGHSRWLMRLPLAWENCVPTATHSTRKPRRASSKRCLRSTLQSLSEAVAELTEVISR